MSSALRNICFIFIFVLLSISQEKSLQFSVGGFYSITGRKYVQAVIMLQYVINCVQMALVILPAAPSHLIFIVNDHSFLIIECLSW